MTPKAKPPVTPSASFSYTRNNTAALFGVSTQQIDKYRSAGLLHDIKVGRLIRFRRDEVEQLVRRAEMSGLPVMPRPPQKAKVRP